MANNAASQALIRRLGTSYILLYSEFRVSLSGAYIVLTELCREMEVLNVRPQAVSCEAV